MPNQYPPPASGGSGADSDSTFVTSTAQSGLPQSRRLVDGTNTTVDVGTPGQIKVNASGGGGTGNFNFGASEAVQSGDYTILTANRWCFYEGTGGNTWQLPIAPTLGESHTFFNYGDGILTINDPGSGGQQFYLTSTVGGRIPLTLTYMGDNESGYTWLAFQTSQNNTGSFELGAGSLYLTYDDGNDNPAYKIDANEAPASQVNITLRDPGITGPQLGLVEDGGGSDGSLMIWKAGPTGGGYSRVSTVQAPVSGKATLVGGTVTVSSADVVVGSVIQLTVQVPGGTAVGQGLSVGTIVNNTSFVINSAATDTSVIGYTIFN